MRGNALGGGISRAAGAGGGWADELVHSLKRV